MTDLEAVLVANQENMSLTLNPERPRIFRITHRDNLAWILDHGLHAASGNILDPNFRSIGNPDLINRRCHRTVTVGPGGTLNDYVPFYFTPFSVMMFNIHTGFNVRQVPNDEIVILVSSLHKVAKLGIPFVFTDQHAYLRTARYFTDLSDLNRLDWHLLNLRDFKHDPDDPGKKDRYQAEALIWKHLPVETLLCVCCHSSAADEKIRTELAKRDLTLQTIVRKDWYF